uniref:hypothetical protein n=1 Tax=Rheinheimera sp. TaxID=1869214 RepID=UPI004047E381
MTWQKRIVRKFNALSTALLSIMTLLPTVNAASAPKPYQLQTSVIRLIAAPEEHYDKNIVVDGIFSGYSENNLFFDEQHVRRQLG